MADLEVIAGKWFAAFNNKELEQLLALYAADARHYSPKLKLRQPETEGLVQGQAALRAWWADAFERLPGLLYVPVVYTTGRERIFMEYVRKAPGEADMLVAEVLEVTGGLITASRVYHG